MEPRNPDATREKILRCAFAEIHRHGFQAASIAKILQDTGLTKGALYHHFPTKQALGLAVIDEVIAAYLEKGVFRPLRESATPVETLLSVLASRRRERPRAWIELGCPLNNLMQEMSPLDETFKRHLNAVLGTWRDSVESALRRGQAQGELRPEIDCAATALFIVSAWEGCIGIAKNLQCADAYATCMQQLHAYVEGLRSAAP